MASQHDETPEMSYDHAIVDACVAEDAGEMHRGYQDALVPTGVVRTQPDFGAAPHLPTARGAAACAGGSGGATKGIAESLVRIVGPAPPQWAAALPAPTVTIGSTIPTMPTTTATADAREEVASYAAAGGAGAGRSAVDTVDTCMGGVTHECPVVASVAPASGVGTTHGHLSHITPVPASCPVGAPDAQPLALQVMQ